MPFLHCRALLPSVACALLVSIALLAGCVISPRRIVVGGPSPTPTPTPGLTPTPSPTPGFTPTPTPIPTPTPGSVEVQRNDGASQFLFTASIESPLLEGFRIRPDGSLMPINGSPFVLAAPVRAMAELDGALVVGDRTGLKLFRVDAESGVIQQVDQLDAGPMDDLRRMPDDSVLAATPRGEISVRGMQGRLETTPAAAPAPLKTGGSTAAVLDAGGRFMYMVDSAAGELRAFQLEDGKAVPLLVPSYPLRRGPAVLALIRSAN